LVNEVIEVDLAEEGGEFEIVGYPLPVSEELSWFANSTK
jgi:hypothetical protein